MKAKSKRGFRFRIHPLFVTIITLILIGIMVVNVLLMHNITADQTEEIGRMRIQNIATGFQRSLTRAEYTLERVCSSLEEILQGEYTEEDIRNFLSEQRAIEYNLSDGICLNIFCVVDRVVMISDMETPKDYVYQDRIWYRGLLATKRGDTYISPSYEDAFTDNMCFTVSKMLEDGSTVGLDYSVEEIQAYVMKLGGDEYGDAMIVDANEVIVGYTDPDMIGKTLSSVLPQYHDVFLRALASNEEDFSLQTSAMGEDSTVFCSQMDNGWYMMCSIRNSTLYRDNYRHLFYNFCFVLLLIFVMVIVYFFGLRGKGQNESVAWNRAERREKRKEKEQDDLTVWNQHRYQFGITAVFVVTMIIAISGSASMSVNESRLRIEEEMREYNTEVAEWVLEQKGILDMFDNVIAAKPELLWGYNGMVQFLDDITKHYPGISATYISNPDFSHGHSTIMNNGWTPDPDFKEEDRPWYTGALKSEDFNITEPYYDVRTGKYCITFSKTVISDKGEFLGVFAIDFYMDVLMDILGQSFSEQGYAFLADRNGIVIDHPHADYQFSEENSVNIHDLAYDRLYRESGLVVIKDYDGKYKVCASMDETASGFRIILVKDWWSIYGNVLQYTVLFLILFGGCILAINIIINKMIQWQTRANENLKEAAAAAIQAERVKSRFLSNMSHEIRTPINAVLGMNEMILRESEDEVLLSYAENIQSSGKTLLFLINDILDMSKIESGKMEIVLAEYDTADIIMDLWNVIYLRAQEKSLTINFILDETLPNRLLGDEVRVKQIVTNLLTNAVKYTHKGSIELHVNYERTQEDGLNLVISVKDTGMGIRQEDMDKLFESFQRLDEIANRNIEGTGLGMYITMMLLDLMGGDIKVESEYQKGSTFTVVIPQKIISNEYTGDFASILSRKKSEPVQKRVRFESPKANVLVVDDNEMNLAVFKALLKHTKMNIVTADSGRQCLEIIKKEPFHIIFMDHMMPEMDGVETLHEMQKLKGSPNEKTPVIALTANAISGAREYYLKEGFADFFSKPMDSDKLERMIVEYLPEGLVHKKEEGAEEGGQENDTAEESGTTAPDRYQEYGISIEKGISYTAGDMDLYLNIMELFINDKERMVKLRQFIEDGKAHDYGILVHALKGDSRTLGADSLADVAYEHEKQSKAGNLAYVEEHWDELVERWE